MENEFAQTRPAVRSDVGLQLLDGDDEPTTENIPAAAPNQEIAPAAAQAPRYLTR